MHVHICFINARHIPACACDHIFALASTYIALGQLATSLFEGFLEVFVNKIVIIAIVVIVILKCAQVSMSP